MMTMKKWLVFICLLSIFAVQFGQVAAAAPASGAARTYQTAFTESEASLSGAVSSKQKYFELMDYWNVDTVKINLDYQATQLAKELISSVTLSVNGHAFHSFRPVAADNGRQRLSVSVPKEWLKKGSNVLEITGYIRTVDNEICAPDDAPDHWLSLFTTSSIDVAYTNAELKAAINDFSHRFAGLDTVGAGQSVLTVPDNGDSAELEAAVYALSGFAKAKKNADKDIPLLPYRADVLEDKQAVVLVGLYDRLPEGIKGLLSKQDYNTKAVIQLVNKDTQPTLVVTSQNPKLLVHAGRFVANPSLMEQTDSDLKIVEESTDVTTPPVAYSTQVTFTETGDEVRGPGHREKSYFVSLPTNRSIADAGQITLDFRYAQNLDFNRSLVTVSINGIPIGSKKLTKEMANGDKAVFAIPSNAAVSGNFSVTVAFDLQMISAACTQNGNQTPWAFLTKDSMINFKTKDRTDMLFNNYPYPFLRDGVYNRVAVVLPEAKDDYTYRSVSNVFNLLGQYANGNTGDVRFYKDTAGSDELKDSNIIAIGTFIDNKLIQENNKNLYFKYDPKGEGILSNEKISIETEYGKRLGTLQLLASPFQAGNGFLAVTGARAENYYLASKLIANENAKWKVYGDGVFTDKDGSVSAYRFKKEAGEGDQSLVKDVLQRGDVLGFLVAFVLIAALAVLSLILLIRKHLKKRGGRDES
ncbi:cellulose biosynthesis cyclic di-GMP-binding regulatory protein BcsB [Paenibacillus chitinolyticus]|uniref:cellulose biosynthesis cyclic di-GMP-binding regulatory protein BcsB n=1 Tax=Paenibacillus chitinolyticus TaxID=79263 RepID=UPI003672A8E9